MSHRWLSFTRLMANDFLETLASLLGFSFAPCLVEDFHCARATFFLGISEHVQCDAVVDMLLRPDTINRLLHLAVAPVPPFHGVRGRRQLFVIEKHQSL